MLGLLDLDVCGRVTLLLIRGAVASMMFSDSCCRFSAVAERGAVACCLDADCGLSPLILLPLQNLGLLPREVGC
jgi:hypothetical protein